MANESRGVLCPRSPSRARKRVVTKNILVQKWVVNTLLVRVLNPRCLDARIKYNCTAVGGWVVGRQVTAPNPRLGRKAACHSRLGYLRSKWCGLQRRVVIKNSDNTIEKGSKA